MLITVRHTTRYIYDKPIRYTVQSLRLTPLISSVGPPFITA